MLFGHRVTFIKYVYSKNRDSLPFVSAGKWCKLQSEGRRDCEQQCAYRTVCCMSSGSFIPLSINKRQNAQSNEAARPAAAYCQLLCRRLHYNCSALQGKSAFH